MKTISPKNYFVISGLVGFFGTIAAMTIDIPTTMNIATGAISPLMNSIVIELALLYIVLLATLFLKTSHATKKEVVIHGTHAYHKYLSIFMHSLFSFIVGGAIGILICFIYLIIGFRMLSPHL